MKADLNSLYVCKKCRFLFDVDSITKTSTKTFCEFNYLNWECPNCKERNEEEL